MRRCPPLLSLVLGCIALATTRAPAQLGELSWGPIDLAAVAGAPLTATAPASGFLGVEEFNGLTYLSSRGFVDASNNWVNSAPHTLYVIDGSGSLVNTIPQPPQVSGQTWGFRDGASDEVVAPGGVLLNPPTVLFFGVSGSQGIFCIDPMGNLVNTYQSANGVQTLPANPIPNVGAVGMSTTNYGLAYDASGNGGQGSWWTGGFGGDLFEIDATGAVLTQFANPGSWDIRGLALDPFRGTLWMVAGSSAITSAGTVDSRSERILEIDIDGNYTGAGTETGNFVVRERAGNIAGGLDGVLGGAGSSGNAFDLVSIDQSVPDTATGYRVHLYAGVDGTREAGLAGGVANFVCTGGGATPVDSTAKNFVSGESLTWTYDTSRDPVALAGLPALLIGNFDLAATALTDASTVGSTAAVPELEAVHSLSSPMGILPTVLGDGIGAGAVVGQVLPLGPANLSGPAVTLPIPVGVFLPGDAIRLQGVYLEANSPVGLMATNQVRFESGDILIEAEGTRSYTRDVTQGFWRVRHLNPSVPSVVQVTFDWSPATGPSPGSFDVDEPAMGPLTNDQFWHGNSTNPLANPAGCAGTYRNGSDAACGLIYDDANTYGPNTALGQIPLICDPNANCGFIASNQVSGNTYRTLTFRFAPGAFACKTFEFDCDHDGWFGESGGKMAGLSVTVTLADTSVRTGVLVVDRNNRLRSYINL